MLFDEKMGGTIHIALGASFPESGGVNKSAIHWDILKNMKVDGQPCHFQQALAEKVRFRVEAGRHSVLVRGY